MKFLKLLFILLYVFWGALSFGANLKSDTVNIGKKTGTANFLFKHRDGGFLKKVDGGGWTASNDGVVEKPLGGGAPAFISATQTGTIASVPSILSVSLTSDISMTLPDPTANLGGTFEALVAFNSSTNTLTILPFGSELIGSATSTQLVAAGSYVKYVSDGTDWIHASSSGRVMIARLSLPDDTGAGTCSTGSFANRILNEVEGDTSVGQIIGTDSLQISGGRYRADFRAASYRSNGMSGRLRDLTNGVTLSIPTVLLNDSAVGYNQYNVGTAVFTATGTTIIAIQQKCGTANANSLGSPDLLTTGQDEVYVQITIEKLGD